MSNRLFQGVMHQMKDTIDRTIGVIDESMAVIACSDLGRIGESCEVECGFIFCTGSVFARRLYI